MTAYRVASPRANDPVDRVLYEAEVQLARRLAEHFERSSPNCVCEDCAAFVGLVETRAERRERLAPDASICARCSVSVAKRDAVVATREFGMSLCPRDHAWATRERLAGRRPIIVARETSHATSPR
jgi:hypothetical protein